MQQVKTLEQVKAYYGKVLSSTADLQTSACCPTEALPERLRGIVSEIHDEIKEKFYGCGSPVPLVLEGATVLDLGCGSGRDVYLLSKLVGPKGRVIGIDMTSEQINLAKKHQDYHAKKYGYSSSNVEFVQGYIEDLEAAKIASNSVDLVVSNCVINLSPDKERVFSEIFRVLKPGGELFFSDVFSGRRVPQEMKSDPVLLGECLAGAMYIEDFRRLMRVQGCLDYRLTAKSRISLNNPEINDKIGMVDFYSMTVRAFKVELEDICEDYGQVAYYKGSIPESPHSFLLDDHHLFVTGQPMLVCGNTAAMVGETRYKEHFTIIGNKKTHYGPFDCKPAAASSQNPTNSTGACC